MSSLESPLHSLKLGLSYYNSILSGIYPLNFQLFWQSQTPSPEKPQASKALGFLLDFQLYCAAWTFSQEKNGMLFLGKILDRFPKDIFIWALRYSIFKSVYDAVIGNFSLFKYAFAISTIQIITVLLLKNDL